MVNSCAAAGCTNRAIKNDNRAFHKFPINSSELCKKWIAAIKRETFIPTEHSGKCSDHFLPLDYSIPDFNNKPKLKPFSVPSIIIDSKPKFKREFSSISPQTNKKRLIEKVSEIGSHHHIDFHSDISDNNNVAASSNEIYINSVILETTESIDCQVDVISSFNIIKSSNKIINDDTIISKSTLSTNASPTKAKLKAKIKILKQKLRRKEKKKKFIKGYAKKSKQKKIVSEDAANVLCENFSGLTFDIIKNQFKNNTSLPKGHRYTDEIKKFAITLHFYSPKAYNFLRAILHLPASSSLASWTSSVDCEPGFF